jgi:hypothetical protein
MSFIDESLSAIAASESVPKGLKLGLEERGRKLDAFLGQALDWWKTQGEAAGHEALRSGDLGPLAGQLHALAAKSGLGELIGLDEIARTIASSRNHRGETEFDTAILDDWAKKLGTFAPRVPGTVNMDAANDWLESELEGFGLSVCRLPLDFRGVFFHDYSLEIQGADPGKLVCFPQNNVGFGEIEAELVDAGRGRSGDYSALAARGIDVRGKIVLVNWGAIWDHEGPCAARERYTLLALYDEAVLAGVSAMIGYFEDTPGNALRLLEPGIAPTGGSNTTGPSESGGERAFTLPALTIGKEDGARIRAALTRGTVRARLRIAGKRKVSTTDNLVASLPGSGEGIIVVGCHSCTAFEGAVCDTSGTVAALAMARHFARLPSSARPKSLLFVFDSFHVWGNCCQAGLQFLEDQGEGRGRIEALLWLDHISDGRTGERLAIASQHPVLWPLSLIAMAKNGRAPLSLPLARLYVPCMPGAFERLGIPVFTQQAMSEVLLSTEDTWDRFDLEEYRRDLSIQVDLLSWLLEIDIARLEPGESAGGCGVLFTSTEMPPYPTGESYAPEIAPPLLRGGESSPVREVLRS